MQRKRNCVPLDRLGVTIEEMVPSTGALDVILYILSMAGVAVLFLFKL